MAPFEWHPTDRIAFQDVSYTTHAWSDGMVTLRHVYNPDLLETWKETSLLLWFIGDLRWEPKAFMRRNEQPASSDVVGKPDNEGHL